MSALRGIMSLRSIGSGLNRVANMSRGFATASRSLPAIPLLERAGGFASKISHPAIISGGKDYSYAQLIADAAAFRDKLLSSAGTDDLAEQRIAFLCPNKYEYAVVQWGIWAAGGVAVPICWYLCPLKLDRIVGDALLNSDLCSDSSACGGDGVHRF